MMFSQAEMERKSDVIQTLILLPICRVYYESNKQYGYYKQYKYIHHDRVAEWRAFHRSLSRNSSPFPPRI